MALTYDLVHESAGESSWRRLAVTATQISRNNVKRSQKLNKLSKEQICYMSG